uniref:Uncharacterized protein n=1 Tax=Arundo donax TaxID=35708 RepID=A0A0A9DQJ7_ARUDO
MEKMMGPVLSYLKPVQEVLLHSYTHLPYQTPDMSLHTQVRHNQKYQQHQSSHEFLSSKEALLSQNQKGRHCIHCRAVCCLA